MKYQAQCRPLAFTQSSRRLGQIVLGFFKLPRLVVMTAFVQRQFRLGNCILFTHDRCTCYKLLHCEPKKRWQYIWHNNSGKTRSIFIILHCCKQEETFYTAWKTAPAANGFLCIQNSPDSLSWCYITGTKGNLEGFNQYTKGAVPKVN